MSLVDKIPLMSDQGVLNMLANARRIAEEGAPAQQASAAEILPALEAEALARKAAKLEAAAAKRAAAPRKKKVVAAPAAAAEVVG